MQKRDINKSEKNYTPEQLRILREIEESENKYKESLWRGKGKYFDFRKEFTHVHVNGPTGYNTPHIYKDKKMKGVINEQKKKRNRSKNSEVHVPRFYNSKHLKANNPRVVDHCLANNVDNALVEDVLGIEMEKGIAPEQVYPQTLVVRPRIQLNLDNLKAVAFSYPAAFLNRFVQVGETIIIPAGEVGVHYLAYATILADLIRAVNGEFTIFSKAPKNYWELRDSITPRERDGWAYAFDTQSIPSIGEILPTLFFENPRDENATLAQFDGMLTPKGQAALVVGIPVLTEGIIDDFGIATTENLWTEFEGQVGTDSIMMQPDKTPYSDTIAAFYTVVDAGPAGFESFGTFRGEHDISKSHQWLAELGLVQGSGRRGNYGFSGINGPVVWNYRVMTHDTSQRPYRVVPKQIPISSVLIAVLAMIAEGDILQHDIEGNVQLQQPTDSILKLLQGNDILIGVISALAKRYAQSTFFMMGTATPNDSFSSIGSGYRFLFSAETDALVLPSNIIEGLANLSFFITDHKIDGRHQMYVPVIGMTGEWTYANPLDNLGTNDNDVTSILEILHPRADFSLGNWTLAASASLPATFDLTQTGFSYFLGDGPREACRALNTVLNEQQGNYDSGPGQSNIHVATTSLYFTSIMDVASEISADDSALLTLRKVTNVHAFTPNEITDLILRIKPAVYADQLQTFAYLALTGEVASVEFEIPIAEHELSQYTQVVHKVAGMGNEQSISDKSKVEQHKGGGFIDTLKGIGSVALPVLGQLGGGLLDSVLPGMGGIVGSLGSAAGRALSSPDKAARAALTSKVLAKSHRNPWAPVLRPISCQWTNLH